MTGDRDGQGRQRYEIRLRGHLSARLQAAFPGFGAEVQQGDTLLRGSIADQSALYGVLAEIEALGLELLELRRLPTPAPGISATVV